MANVSGKNSNLLEKINKPTDIQEEKRPDVKLLLRDVNIKKRFEDVLGKNAPAFISSLIGVANGNRQLQVISRENPMSIISAGAIAAALNLPVDPNLGFAYIIPYGSKATFQMGYKGFIQLAMRTGQYKTINASEVYEGEIVKVNRFTGDMDFGERTSDKIIGYIAYFKLINGFEKYLYMTKEEIEKHGKTYSKSFGSKDGRWQQDFHAMAIKTVLKRLLSKYGILSIEMQGGMGTALAADSAVINQDDEGNPSYEYVDGTIDVDGVPVDTETGEVVENKPEPEQEPEPETSKEPPKEAPAKPVMGDEPEEGSMLAKHRQMTARLHL